MYTLYTTKQCIHYTVYIICNIDYTVYTLNIYTIYLLYTI